MMPFLFKVGTYLQENIAHFCSIRDLCIAPTPRPNSLTYSMSRYSTFWGLFGLFRLGSGGSQRVL